MGARAFSDLLGDLVGGAGRQVAAFSPECRDPEEGGLAGEHGGHADGRAFGRGAGDADEVVGHTGAETRGDRDLVGDCALRLARCFEPGAVAEFTAAVAGTVVDVRCSDAQREHPRRGDGDAVSPALELLHRLDHAEGALRVAAGKRFGDCRERRAGAPPHGQRQRLRYPHDAPP